MRRTTIPMAVLAVLALLISGCGSGAGDDDMAADAVDAASAPEDAADAADDAEVAAGDGGDVASADATTVAPASDGGVGGEAADGLSAEDAPASPPTGASGTGTDPLAPGTADVAVAFQPADLGRDIVFIGDLRVAVDDVTAGATQAQQVLAPFGALVFGQQTTTEPEPTTTLVLKVLPGDFSAAMVALAGIGDLLDQRVSADDVTERVVDLQSQILTAETSVERLRGFLADANDLTTITQIEQQLLVRETELETLRGQLRTLQSATALATINLTLVERVRPVPAADLRVQATVQPGADGGARCAEDDQESDLEVDGPDQPVTLCLQITNTGDTALGALDIRDEGLEITASDLVVISGDPDAVLAPDGVLVLALDLRSDREPVRSDTVVSMVPVDDEGVPLGDEVSDRASTVTRVAADDDLPGFSRVLAASWGALAWLGGALLLVLAAALPFLWVPILGWALWRWRRRPRTVA